LEAQTLIAAVPERTATRDELVREVADRLDVPVDYVTSARPAPRREPVPAPDPVAGDPGPEVPASARTPGEATLGVEREFLTRCLASGELGRDFLARLSDEHLSSPTSVAARAHLIQSFDDPLAGLPDHDPALGALVNAVVMAAHEQPPSSEAVLRMSFLQLEQRRIARELRGGAQESDTGRRTELAAALQQVRRELDQMMGQTA
jgi:hypothetical protein